MTARPAGATMTSAPYGLDMETVVRTEDTELAETIRLADASLRKTCAGLDVDEVAGEVARSMDALHIDLGEETLRDYAQHISDRADYELVLP